jgi:hypothetical protein
MPVTLPWSFPPHAETLAAEGQRLRQLTTVQRLERLLTLIETGRHLREEFPERPEQRQYRESQEQLWRDRWSQLFAKQRKR